LKYPIRYAPIPIKAGTTESIPNIGKIKLKDGHL
jgi:hypothetical protein